MKIKSIKLLNFDTYKYRGRVVMTVNNHLYSTSSKDGKKIAKMVEEIRKRHHKVPLITYVPKADTLIV